jgi:DNA end-binding protein Ku
VRTANVYRAIAFVDHYSEKLLKVVETKVAGKEVIAPPPADEPAQVVNLMDALKRSVELTQKKGDAGKAEKEKPPRKMAPSKGKETPTRKRKSS